MSKSATNTQAFNDLLARAVSNGASDVHIKSNHPPFMRLNGKLEILDEVSLSAEAIMAFLKDTMPERFAQYWQENAQIDYAYVLSSTEPARFRVSGFHQRACPTLVFRHVKDKVPTLDDLGHDAQALEKISQQNDGIVLVCGATGAGKSSTIAGMLSYINSHFNKHVITLEDPIEYSYSDNQAIFSQREIGIDVPSFSLGLKASLRQDPDVILIGEMRDAETFETAIQAAETGHLVFSTMHAGNAQQAIQRLFEFFPVEQQEAIRRQVASVLRAIVVQKLVPSVDGSVRPVVELLLMDSTARSVIERGKFEKIPQVIEANAQSGSKTFNHDLYRLAQAGAIHQEDALAASPNPRALEMNLKGIFLSEGGLIS